MPFPLKNPLPFENDLVKLYEELEEKQKTGRKSEIEKALRKFEEAKGKVYSNLNPYQRVQLARHLDRPTSITLIKFLIDDFIELHGDRRFGDDPAIICGLGKIGQFRVVIVAQEKGGSLKEKTLRNFGMPQPEGYRKALRLFRLAEKFELPIITIIDTPGAYPGDEAEERGQAQAIAENLLELSSITVPVIGVLLSEGGSGGALALGIVDRLFMFENAYYSVISPEGCASILFGEEAQKYVGKCAEMLKVTSENLYRFKIVDEIIKEPLGGLQWGYEESFRMLKDRILATLAELSRITVEELLERRRIRYYSIGAFEQYG